MIGAEPAALLAAADDDDASDVTALANVLVVSGADSLPLFLCFFFFLGTVCFTKQRPLFTRNDKQHIMDGFYVEQSGRDAAVPSEYKQFIKQICHKSKTEKGPNIVLDIDYRYFC